jgi:hypothetical protein
VGTSSLLFVAEDEDPVEDKIANAGLDNNNGDGEVDKQIDNTLAAA